MPAHDDGAPWMPPQELRDLIKSLPLTIDKVEAVIVFYANDHGGNAPTLDEIADVLSISKQTVYKRVFRLIEKGRAKRKHGKLIIKEGAYTHPLIAAPLPR